MFDRSGFDKCMENAQRSYEIEKLKSEVHELKKKVKKLEKKIKENSK